jgi:hypothetical protein
MGMPQPCAERKGLICITVVFILIRREERLLWGYGYVAASRFKSRQGCYVFGKLRRSDFLPAGAEKEDDVTERGYESVSSSDSDGCGLEQAFAQAEEYEDTPDFRDEGNLVVDFL